MRIIKALFGGLLVAALMGVFFGLVIGVVGYMMGTEAEQLYKLGAMSGWISGFVAMGYMFSRARRFNQHAPIETEVLEPVFAEYNGEDQT